MAGAHGTCEAPRVSQAGGRRVLSVLEKGAAAAEAGLMRALANRLSLPQSGVLAKRLRLLSRQASLCAGQGAHPHAKRLGVTALAGVLDKGACRMVGRVARAHIRRRQVEAAGLLALMLQCRAQHGLQ